MPKHSTEAAFADRLKSLRRSMRDAGLDGLLVTDPMDVGYLTGFLGGDSYLYIGRGKPVIVSDGRYAEEVDELRPAVRVVMRSGPMMPAIAEQIAKGRPERFGIQSEHLSVASRAALVEGLRAHKVRKSAVTDTSGLMTALRRNKDAGEIRLIRKALSIQQDALEATLPTIAAGQSELEVCARLEFEMKSRGSTNPSFSTIVAARANGSKAHYSPGSTRTARNRTLLIDWGATWRGYHGDMTRTFTLGRWPKPMREVYEIVLEAHEAGAASLKAGVTGAQADAAARGVIERAGYGDQFSHSLGHGVGLNVHEMPGLSRHAADVPLATGDVVTIEPGIYLPGVGGVRIEDVYSVTPRGATNLCRLPKDLAFATL